MALLDKSGIIRRLTIADSLARKELEYLKGPVLPDPSEFEEHIHRYVLYKFLLDDEVSLPETRDLNELAQLSVAKAGRLNPNEAALLDVSRHCGSTSSFMTKKVLLFMSLSREFGFEYPPYDTAQIETTGALAHIVMEKIGERTEAGSGNAGRQDRVTEDDRGQDS